MLADRKVATVGTCRLLGASPRTAIGGFDEGAVVAFASDPLSNPLLVGVTAPLRSFAAIRWTLPKGVRAQPRLDEGGGFKITLDRLTLDRLRRFAGGVRLQRHHSAPRGRRRGLTRPRGNTIFCGLGIKG